MGTQLQPNTPLFVLLNFFRTQTTNVKTNLLRFSRSNLFALLPCVFRRFFGKRFPPCFSPVIQALSPALILFLFPPNHALIWSYFFGAQKSAFFPGLVCKSGKIKQANTPHNLHKKNSLAGIRPQFLFHSPNIPLAPERRPMVQTCHLGWTHSGGGGRSPPSARKVCHGRFVILSWFGISNYSRLILQRSCWIPPLCRPSPAPYAMGCLTFCSIIAGIDQVGRTYLYFVY